MKRLLLAAIVWTLPTLALAGWLPRGAWIDNNPGNYWKCQSGIASYFTNVWWRPQACTSLVYGQYWSSYWGFCSSPWWLASNYWQCDDPPAGAPLPGPVPVNMGPGRPLPAIPPNLSDAGPVPDGAPAPVQPDQSGQAGTH